MEVNTKNKDIEENKNRFPFSSIQIGGLALIALGVDLFFASFLKMGWLALLIIPIGGLIFLLNGIRTKRIWPIILGGLIIGLGIGAFLAFGNVIGFGVERRIGLLLLSFALGWGSIALFSKLHCEYYAWWALIPGGIIASISLAFLISDLRFIDFVFYILTGTGLILLIWGILWRLFGLIIPGSLLVGIGPGLFLAWGEANSANGLTQTGIMLVWFALGWGFIILFSRVITEKFIWWPLIPGGILAVVGWGLYIGGNPGNAVSFIGNTGSVGLMILGLYLLLLRNGIRK